ncbi:MAG: glutathione S-transferase N-terminal domain-containing protein, partial [Pseudomonadales bacterium]|nr:glutathione S-transferase N-terminal domain-containing protein [Pseudomonadales bacterium]
MKLYDNVQAPNPRRVRVFLAEKQIDIERVPVDMMKGEHKTPEFLRKNANGQIPVLELD